MLATLCSSLIATKAGSDRCIPGTLRRNSVRHLPPPGKIVGLHDIPVAKRCVRADQAVATGHNGLFVTGEHRRADDEGQDQAKRERDTPEQAHRNRSEHDAYQNLLDDELKDALWQRYEQDFIAFNYSP